MRPIPTLDIIGERWTMLLICDLFLGRRRFKKFLTSSEGITPNILSERLRRLENAGLIVRRRYTEHPPRDAPNPLRRPPSPASAVIPCRAPRLPEHSCSLITRAQLHCSASSDSDTAPRSLDYSMLGQASCADTTQFLPRDLARYSASSAILTSPSTTLLSSGKQETPRLTVKRIS